MGRFVGLIVTLGIAVAASGCAAIKGHPDRSGDPAEDLKQLEPFHAPDVISKYTSASNDDRNGLTRQQYRDEVVNARIAAIDLHFNSFQQELFQGEVGKNIATDFAVIGMGATATLVGGGAAQALGAAITGVTGAKSAFDKNVYFEKTMPAILAKMVAERKQTLVRLRTGLTQPDSDYPLTRALVDLEDYYNAGTIQGAIIAVAETAGAESKDADDQLEAIEFRRAAGFSTTEVRGRISAILARINAADAGVLLPLAINPPVPDSEKIAKLLNLRFPNQVWKTDPKAARAALTMRVTIGDRSEDSLKAWEDRLGIRN